MGVGVFTMMTMWGHFPLALYFGGEFCTAVAKKQKSTAKVCKSRHILMEKRSEVTIFRQ